MATFPLDEAIDLWRCREVGQIDKAFGKSVRTKSADGAWRNGEVLLDIEDPSGLGRRAEVYLYEVTGDADVVGFTVCCAPWCLARFPRRVHLWGVDLRWADGGVGLLDAGVPGGAVSAIEGPVLRPGIERLIHAAYQVRRRSIPFGREQGRPYGALR
ncbi:hypothetical protein KIN34_01550 [Cellulomonas sp. DKR-3]|uniref:DUF402 domain-containing protein n=1 Tax=Cellulomonas fulva TaxID=2835530 RepID=A0ABS5TV40_9CELL|nr:hypothetical protein [Cellulomonas fulva]MBT0992976.1 hypothetical protein [Cellulomonas fulva]